MVIGLNRILGEPFLNGKIMKKLIQHRLSRMSKEIKSRGTEDLCFDGFALLFVPLLRGPYGQIPHLVSGWREDRLLLPRPPEKHGR